jgi:Tol biopolymer transport system component
MKYILILIVILLSSCITTGYQYKSLTFIDFTTYNYSPDGNKIIFTCRFRKGDEFYHQLFVYNKITSNIIKVFNSFDMGVRAVYSHNGKYIAFVKRIISNNIISNNNEINYKYITNTQIFIMNSNFQSIKQLTKTNAICSYPFWSHNDSKIYYLTVDWKDTFIYSIDTKGNNNKCLTKMISINNNPQCTRDDKNIIFATMGDKYMKLVKHNIISDQETILVDKIDMIWPYTMHKNDKVIYYANNMLFNSVKEGFYSINIDGSSNTMLFDYILHDIEFCLSPDDKHILYSELGNLIELDIINSNKIELPIATNKLLSLCNN